MNHYLDLLAKRRSLFCGRYPDDRPMYSEVLMDGDISKGRRAVRSARIWP